MRDTMISSFVRVLSLGIKSLESCVLGAELFMCMTSSELTARNPTVSLLNIIMNTTLEID